VFGIKAPERVIRGEGNAPVGKPRGSNHCKKGGGEKALQQASGLTQSKARSATVGQQGPRTRNAGEKETA